MAKLIQHPVVRVLGFGWQGVVFDAIEPTTGTPLAGQIHIEPVAAVPAE